MAVICADGLSLAFGKKVILSDASVAVEPGERVGVVGPNGSGKSTLFRILAGEQSPDHGEVHYGRGVSFGYLPQDILALPKGTVLDAALASVPRREALEQALVEVESALAVAGDDETRSELAGRLADLHAELADFDQRHGRHVAERILLGLGFSSAELNGPVAALSGGFKMRVALAGLLLLDPEVLLLDEPTNHLDVPSLAWFDDFLERSRKALLLISHDREFLNRQVASVLSFEPEGLRLYAGNYDDYRRQREEEEQHLEVRARRQAAERARVERFIERFRAKATKARQVQSRVRALAKVERIVAHDQHARVHFRFPEVERSGKEVLKIEGLHKRFGDKVLYQGLTRSVTRGERVAVIGKNGAGKTTLLRMMAGELTADAGGVSLGHKVQRAYYAQHHSETLDPAKTVLEQVWSLVPMMAQASVRGILGAFLFSGDDVDKPISVLSGGERARVALARLLVVPSNLMLMDEPTNHLDLVSAERLVAALAAYQGTLVFVSHNQSFINQLATRVWDVRAGEVVEWTGNLDNYLYHLQQIGEPMGGVETAGRGQAGGEAPTGESAKDRRRREAQERREQAARLKPLRQEIASLERRIGELERQKREIEPTLVAPDFYNDFARSEPVLARYREVQAELEALYTRWEVVSGGDAGEA